MDLKFLARICGLAAALLLSAGCESNNFTLKPVPTKSTPADMQPQGFAGWTDQLPAYRLGPGDRVQIRYLDTPELDEEALVAPDGTVSLRPAPQVMAAGYTLPELSTQVAIQSRSWLKDPKVSVALKESASGRIYVGGQVARAGTFSVNGRIGVLESILMAGGFADDARIGEVVLIRRSPENRPMLRTVDVKEFLQTGTTANDVPLVSGDIVFVPRSTIGEVNLWIDQFINRVLPFQRSANFTYSIYRQQNPVLNP
ncbi:MAG: polysaccharide export protein [Alphaproteobacteria bacterium]|jgi:protein involved in polysaccharide export with SLBB domain|nr:polysaccharide export protein [Alphaproteobacteria bacterium]